MALKKGILSFLLLITILVVIPVFGLPLSSIAFFYGPNPPMTELRAFDVVVVDPGQSIEPSQFLDVGTEPFAYVSVGEADPKRAYFHQISPSWIIGQNEVWGAKVLDQSNPVWRKFFVDQVITPLWQKGYRGFFLDTLDSFNLVAKTDEARKKQMEGLVQLIQLIKLRYPTAKLIFNRGFEILPETHQLAYAVAVESLFAGWNQAKQEYQAVSSESRQWLLSQLKEAQAYHLPIISIDYLPPAQRQEARIVANQIEKLGFIPWIADPTLQSVGLGSVEAIPRTILVLYDVRQTPNLLLDNFALRFGSTPLNYLGYVLKFQDIRKPLPEEILRGRIAGILSWISGAYLKSSMNLEKWLVRQKTDGVPIVFLDSLGGVPTSSFEKTFNIEAEENKEQAASVKITYQSPMMGYEIQPFAHLFAFSPIIAKGGEVLLSLKDNLNRQNDVAAIMPWGGYALSPYVITTLPNGEMRWIINPLDFFQKAFHQPTIPIPDTTTENGRRLMMVHVDGDGFVNRVEWNAKLISAESMLLDIFDRYQVPTTVSVIEGEVSPEGMYPKNSQLAMSVARKIFRLPWVEVASHSFSHPFIWNVANRIRFKKEEEQAWHLTIPHYQFSIDKEVLGSVKFIDRELAPKNKACTIFLWSGDCNPDAKTVALTYQDGLLNMNGGDTTITDSNNSLTNMAPLGVYRENYFQVFAPDQNENIYTNLWRGPFYGYDQAIETFKLTDKPIRFKPIDIYYHFYSASKIASLKALQAVYDWALAQPVMNIYASQYIKKVLDFNTLVVAKKGEGWFIKTHGDLREFRVPKSLGYPDLQKSQNIIGFSLSGHDYYVHLGTANTADLVLSPQEPKIPHLVEANGRIMEFNRDGKNVSFKIQSYRPTEFILGAMQGCGVTYHRRRIGGAEKISRDQFKFVFKEEMPDAFSVRC